MTNIGKRLLSHFPPAINKSGEILSAMFANENGTGAIEKMFAYGDTVKKNYAESDNVYKMDSDLIDQAMNVFSWFKRFYNEPDASFNLRNKSIFIRGYDKTFGTTWNVKHVFEYYFGNAKVFLLENIGKWEDNLLTDSSFESKDPEIQNVWVKENCEINADASFNGEKGIRFTGNGKLSQTKNIESGIYFVTLAVKGNVDVEVKGSDGKSKKLFIIGEKLTDEIGGPRNFVSETWNFFQVFFKSNGSENITVSVNGTKNTDVDLVTLDKYETYPRFVVYVWFDAVKIGNKTLHLAQSGNDPIPGINYDNERYFEHSFFSGVSGKSFANDVYYEILNMVKAEGTKGEIELLIKESA